MSWASASRTRQLSKADWQALVKECGGTSILLAALEDVMTEAVLQVRRRSAVRVDLLGRVCYSLMSHRGPCRVCAQARGSYGGILGGSSGLKYQGIQV